MHNDIPLPAARSLMLALSDTRHAPLRPHSRGSPCGKRLLLDELLERREQLIRLLTAVGRVEIKSGVQVAESGFRRHRAQLELRDPLKQRPSCRRLRRVVRATARLGRGWSRHGQWLRDCTGA